MEFMHTVTVGFLISLIFLLVGLFLVEDGLNTIVSLVVIIFVSWSVGKVFLSLVDYNQG